MHIKGINNKKLSVIEPKTFFSVSLRENLYALQNSIPLILELYPYAKYYLICRAADIEFFAINLHQNKNVKFINEDSLISFNRFTNYYKKIITHSQFQNKTDSRLSWYYQQSIKIIFMLKLEKNKKNFPMVMFDADSIPLKKIIFFNDINISILYGSLSEKHLDYFKSLDFIFDSFDYPLLGFTTQFFSSTLNEVRNIELIIKKKYHNIHDKNVEELVTCMILESTLKAHGSIEGSKFSEQELVGVSNSLNSSQSKQTPIISFRSWVLDGMLSSCQIRILRLLSVSLVTYENRITFESRQIGWLKFLLAVSADLKPQIIQLIKIKFKIIFSLFYKNRKS